MTLSKAIARSLLRLSERVFGAAAPGVGDSPVESGPPAKSATGAKRGARRGRRSSADEGPCSAGSPSELDWDALYLSVKRFAQEEYRTSSAETSQGIALLTEVFQDLSARFQSFVDIAREQQGDLTQLVATSGELDKPDGKPAMRDFIDESDRLMRCFVETVVNSSHQSMALVGRFQTLREEVEAIRTAVEEIGAVAGKTTQLVLDAEIESVRAGEAGRGLAVVAEEVRNLARTTADLNERAGRSIRVLLEDAEAACGCLEALASQDLSFALEAEERVQSIYAEVDDFNRSLADLAMRLRDASARLQEETKTAVTSLQFGDVLGQKFQAGVERIGYLAELEDRLVEIAQDPSEESAARLREKLEECRRLSRELSLRVTQSQIGSGETELF